MTWFKGLVKEDKEEHNYTPGAVKVGDAWHTVIRCSCGFATPPRKAHWWAMEEYEDHKRLL